MHQRALEDTGEWRDGEEVGGDDGRSYCCAEEEAGEASVKRWHRLRACRGQLQRSWDGDRGDGEEQRVMVMADGMAERRHEMLWGASTHGAAAATMPDRFQIGSSCVNGVLNDAKA